MTHHTRQEVLAALRTGQDHAVLLGAADTAWHPLWPEVRIAGPGLVTYVSHPATGSARTAAFDPLAGDGDPRCDVVSVDGDVCRLLPGDHATHYWGEL